MSEPDRPVPARTCPDPECGQLAEPDQDGDTRYHVCTGCGYEFGHQRLHPTLTANTDNSCPVGIPEPLRRRAAAATRAPLPLLSIGKRPTATS